MLYSVREAKVNNLESTNADQKHYDNKAYIMYTLNTLLQQEFCFLMYHGLNASISISKYFLFVISKNYNVFWINNCQSDSKFKLLKDIFVLFVCAMF